MKRTHHGNELRPAHAGAEVTLTGWVHLLKKVWKTALTIDIAPPFKRVSFQQALNRWGIDKPDNCFGMDLVDFTEDFRASTFKVFSIRAIILSPRSWPRIFRCWPQTFFGSVLSTTASS